MALFAKLISYPPLAQVTVLPASRKQIGFSVIIESSQDLPEQPWETSIWYDHAGYTSTKAGWQALDLKKTDAAPTALAEGPLSKVRRHTFTGNLPSPFPDSEKTYKGRRIQFTVRYRTDSGAPWQWAKTQFGTADGEIIAQAPVDSDFVSASPVELEPGWNLRKLTSEALGARLYSIESSNQIPSSGTANAKFESKVLGRVTLSHRFFALVRIWSPWLAPRHGENVFNITEDAVLCSFLRIDGLHVVLLATNGIDDILTLFKSDEAGDIVVTARNDTGKDGKFRILASVAPDFEVALASCIYELRRLVKHSLAYKEMSEHLPPHIEAESVDSDTVLVSSGNQSSDQPRSSPQWLQDWRENFSFCTWNSLGQSLTADRVMVALNALAANNINISTLILDDNWQSLDGVQGETSQFHRGMTDFEANKVGFPSGMKAFTSQVREKYPHIQDIAVWHALLGYWGGISPDGSIAKNYKTIEVQKSAGVAEGKMLVVHPDDAHRFYDDFYTFLSDAGVTGVKTDAQFMLDLLADTSDRRAFTVPYQSAWTYAHLQHLAGKAISCMSQIPQILFHSFLTTTTPRIVLRNSDDFFPNIPDSHPWHVFCNAHNALLIQHLNVLPDWDMFQTAETQYSHFHAAARCVSGGPIYITDTPGKHDIGLIAQMTAKNTRGQSVILRPSNVGKSRGIYDNITEGHCLRVGVYDGKSEVGTGILGVFNISDHDISFVLPVTDIPGVDNQEAVGDSALRKWIIRSHVSRRITKPITPTLPLTPDQLLQATLPVRGYDIWSALPVHTFDLNTRDIDVAVLGLLGKMTGACALLESKFSMSEAENTRLRIHVQLKALGTLGLWISDIRSRKVEDLMVMMQQKAVPQSRVSIEPVGGDQAGSGRPSDAGVLAIDVEGAWDDLGLDAGWGNEVGVEIFIQ